MALLHRITVNGKIGYKNQDGEVVIKPEYDNGCFSFGKDHRYAGPYCSVVKDGVSGIIDEEGKVIVPFEFQDTRVLFDDLFAVRRLDYNQEMPCRWGVINSIGTVIIPFSYDWIDSSGSFIRCSFTPVLDGSITRSFDGNVKDHQKNENAIWFNRLGEKIYEGMGIEAQADYLVIEKEEHLGLIDQNGVIVLPIEYEEIHCIDSQLVVVRKSNEDGGWSFGVINLDTGIIIPFIYKYIEFNSDSFIKCYKQSDCEKERHIPYGEKHTYKYTNMSEPEWYNRDGILVHIGEGSILNPSVLGVVKNGLWGAYNKNNKRVVNFQYDTICSINDNLVVGKDGKIGLLNSVGEIIISPSYQSIECVDVVNKTYGGFSSKKLHGCYCLENPFDTESPAIGLYRKRAYYYKEYIGLRLYVTGKDDFKWDNIFILSNENYAELFSINEGVIAESRFESIFHLTSLSYAVKKGNKWGVFRIDAKELIIPCEYERIVFEGGHVVLLYKDGLWGAKSLVLPSHPWYSLFKVDIPFIYLEIKILDSLQCLFGVKKRTDYYSLLTDKIESSDIYTIVRSDGKEIDAINTDSQFEFYRKDRILSSRHKKCGFVSLDGYDSIPFKYDEVLERNDGLFDAQIDKKWGIIDIEGNEVVTIKYKEKIPETFDKAVVQDFYSERYGILSKSGRELVPAIYEHLIIKDDIIYFGYNGRSAHNSFYNIESDSWGCMDLSGKLIIQPVYHCFIQKDGYILAGRDGCFIGPSWRDYCDEFSGVYDLYTKSGEMLFGGFDEFYIEGDYFFFLLNGAWDSYVEDNDHWNNTTAYGFSFNKKNAVWLVLDKSLQSVKFGEDGKRVQFEKGFKVKIRTEKKGNHTSYYFNFDVTVLQKEKPSLVDDYLISHELGRSHAIRLADGIVSDSYDEMLHFSGNLFFVKNGKKVGIASFDNNIVIPFKYFAVTIPVNGFAFAFQEFGKDGQPFENTFKAPNGFDKLFADNQCSVYFLVVEGDKIKILSAIKNKPLGSIIKSIQTNQFRISILPNTVGLKSVAIPQPSLFEEEFAKLICGEQQNHYYFSERYWFPKSDYLIENNDDDDCFDNNQYNEADSWDAMTDGQYGDMPEGFDGDYGFLGEH